MCVAPCRLNSYNYLLPACNGSTIAGFLQGDFSSSAEFFVCVGVFGFLYCTATLILYLGYQSVYRQSARGPMIVSSHLQQAKSVFTFESPVVRLGKHTGTVSDSRLCVFFGSSTPQKKFTFTSFICCKSTNYTLNSCCQCLKCQTRTFFFFPMHDYHCSLVEDDSFHCGISSRPTVWMNGMTAL